jgi:hypothetical protein
VLLIEGKAWYLSKGVWGGIVTSLKSRMPMG